VARPRWTLLLALLLVPTVTAQGSGTFQVEEGATLPKGTTVGFAPALVFLSDTGGLGAIEIRADRVTLYEYADDRLQISGTPVDFSTSKVKPNITVLRDVHMVLERRPPGGFLGIYPSADASGTLVAGSRLEVEARSRGRAATGTGDSDLTKPDADPKSPIAEYERTLPTPHVWMEGSGQVAYGGAGMLKMMGPDLLVTSREGPRRVDTGVEQVSPVNATYRWAVLEMENATVTMESRDSWLLAAPEASVQWEGEARLSSASGSLDVPEGRYAVSKEPARLAGRFDATFAPEERGGKTTTRLVIHSAEVHDTSMRLASGPLWQGTAGSADPPRFLFLLLGVVGVGASFGAGLVITRRRRALRPPPLTVEDCMAAATQAADEEDWSRAIDWLRRVRRMAPTSSRTCADLAHALCQTGRHDEGLRMYEEASRLAHDGEADFNGAVVAVEAGRPPHEVEAWLERALARTPMYVVDVDSDPVFHALRGRAGFERIVADAWTRMDDDALVL
jgi:hypothetical protein